MTILWNPEDFEVKEFYMYPTSVLHRIVEFDNGFHENSPNNVEDVKDFFEEILNVANKKLNKNLMDNKIAFKVVHIPTGTLFYIGLKDGIYRFGFGVKQEYDRKIIL
mgnify:CR=1 FL=1